MNGFYPQNSFVRAGLQPISTHSTSTSSSEQTSPTQSDGSYHSSDNDIVCERTGGLLCDHLQGDGILNHEFKTVSIEKKAIPDIDVTEMKNVENCLKQPCELEVEVEVASAVEGKETKQLIKFVTAPFTVLEMVTDLDMLLSLQIDPSIVEDVQIVGSAVPPLLPNYPLKFPEIEKHWDKESQDKFAQRANDLDIRIKLKERKETPQKKPDNNKTEEKSEKGKNPIKVVKEDVLEKALETVINFVAKKIQAPGLAQSQKYLLAKQHFFTKTSIIRDKNSESSLEYLSIGFSPKGQPPVDFLVINEIPREHLWTQNIMRVSFKGLVNAQKRIVIGSRNNAVTAPCSIIPVDRKDMIQGISDKSSRIVRLDNYKGIDPFSTLPILFSTYAKGDCTVEKLHDMEAVLLKRFMEATTSLAKDTSPQKSWMQKVLVQPVVLGSSDKYVYVLAEGLYRAVKAHHQERSDACAAMTLTACRSLLCSGQESQAILLWQEMQKIRNCRSKHKEISGLLGTVTCLLDKEPKLLTVILPLLELKTLQGLQRTSTDGYACKLPMSSPEFGVQMKSSGKHLLFPSDPSGASFRLIQAWNNLDPSLRASAEDFIEQIESVNGEGKEQLLSAAWDPTIFTKTLTLPSSLIRLILGIHFTEGKYPEFFWLQENWDKLFAAYSSREERLQLIKQFQQNYSGVEEQLYLKSLETLFSKTENNQTSLSSLKSEFLFVTHTNKQIAADYVKWKQIRKEMPQESRALLDEKCLLSINDVRPDIAAEILCEMFADGMPIRGTEEHILSILQSANKIHRGSPITSRLKRLLEVIAAPTAIGQELSPSKEIDCALIQLTEGMLLSKCIDKDFSMSVCSIIDPKNTPRELCIAIVDHLVEKKEFQDAFSLWKLCERRKLMKDTTSKRSEKSILQLVTNVEFSPNQETVWLYLEFQRVSLEAAADDSFSSIHQLLHQLQTYTGEWTENHACALKILLRAPIIAEYIKKNGDDKIAEILIEKISSNVASSTNESSFMCPSEKLDYVTALQYIGCLRNDANALAKARFSDNFVEIVRILYNHNCTNCAGELLKKGKKLKKIAFIKAKDTEMLTKIITVNKDFISYYYYKNFVNLQDQDSQLSEWIASASLSEWENVFSVIASAEETNASLCRFFWPHICASTLKQNAFNEDHCQLIERSSNYFSITNSSELIKIFENIEKICAAHKEKSRDKLVDVFSKLFTLTKSSSNDLHIALGNARLAVANNLNMGFGVTAQWNEIDENLALTLATLRNGDFHDVILPTLLQFKPTKDICSTVCKVMDSPKKETCSQVVEYLRDNNEIGLITPILHHPNIVKILSEDPLEALKSLQSLLEDEAIEKSVSFQTDVVSVAMLLLKFSEKAEKNKYWITKSVELLKKAPLDDLKLRTIVYDNYDDLYVIANSGECNSALYPLLRHRVLNTQCGPLPRDTANVYCRSLVDLIPDKMNSHSATMYIQFINKCMEKNVFEIADKESLGLLLVNSLKVGSDASENDVSILISRIAAIASLPDLFKNPTTGKTVESLFLRFDKHWNPLMTQLVDAMKSVPECKKCTAQRIVSSLDENEQKSYARKEKLKLLLDHTEFLKENVGEEYVSTCLTTAILSGKEELDPELERLFERCFSVHGIPPNAWEKLFKILNASENPTQKQSIASCIIPYVVAHHNNPDEYETVLTVLSSGLSQLPKQLRNDIPTLLNVPNLLCKLVSNSACRRGLDLSCCRQLLQHFVIALPDQLDTDQSVKWEHFRNQAVAFLNLHFSARMLLEPSDQIKNEQFECTSFNLSMFLLNSARWGDEESFLHNLDSVPKVLNDLHDPNLIVITFGHLRAMCDNMPAERKKIVLSKIIDSISINLCSTEHPKIADFTDDFIKRYANCHSNDELFAKCENWIKEGSYAFSSSHTVAMVKLYKSDHFKGCEDKYFAYLEQVAERDNPIALEVFLDAMRSLDKNQQKLIMKLTLKYFANYHERLRITVLFNGIQSESIVLISHLKDALQQFLSQRKHFPSVVKDTTPANQSSSSSNGFSVVRFDEDCIQALGILYYWLNVIDYKKYASLHESLRKNFCEHIKKLSPQPNMSILILCQVKLNFMKEYPKMGNYDEFYEELLSAVREGMQNVRTTKDADLYTQVLLEFCLLESPGQDKETLYLSKESLLVHSFKDDLVLASTLKQIPLLFLMTHIVAFRGRDLYSRITPDDIIVACDKITARVDSSFSTRRGFLLNVLVPEGNTISWSEHKLTTQKIQTFARNPDKYHHYWKQLFKNLPKVLDTHEAESHFSALSKLLMSSDELKFYGIEYAESWRPVVSKIVIDAVSEEGLGNRSLNVRAELDLLHRAHSRGYFDDNPEAYFNGVFNVGERWLYYWHRFDEKQKSSFKKRFFESVALMEKNKFASDKAQERQIKYKKFYKNLSEKEEATDNSDYTEILASLDFSFGVTPQNNSSDHIQESVTVLENTMKDAFVDLFSTTSKK